MYLLILNGVVLSGPSAVDGKPSKEMKSMEMRTGGKILPARINKPIINSRMHMHGAYDTVIHDDHVDYDYPVLDRALEDIRKDLTKEIQAEAGQRINLIWDPKEEGKADFRQRNAIRADLAAGTTDPRFIQTDAIREASNTFEANLVNMTRKALAAVNVAEWEGWPNEG